MRHFYTNSIYSTKYLGHLKPETKREINGAKLSSRMKTEQMKKLREGIFSI